MVESLRAGILVAENGLEVPLMSCFRNSDTTKNNKTKTKERKVITQIWKLKHDQPSLRTCTPKKYYIQPPSLPLNVYTKNSPKKKKRTCTQKKNISNSGISLTCTLLFYFILFSKARIPSSGSSSAQLMETR